VWSFAKPSQTTVPCAGITAVWCLTHTPEILHSGPAFDRDHEILRQNPISLTDFDVLRSWLDRGKSGLA
jgi:hypothetical protein